MKNLFLHKDEELMVEIKADNMFAFDLLYKKYCYKLFKFIFSLLKSEEESENIVQDVFLSLWVNRSNIEKDASVRYYIFTIAYNLSISALRKKTREIKLIDNLKDVQVSDHGSVDAELEYNELSFKLDQIIDNLPQRQKEVYLLHKVEELKYAEIAKRLKISVNTIENHMSRALKTIRAKLL